MRQNQIKDLSPFDALSIVIPAYNEARRIGPTLKRVLEYCRGHIKDFEIIVVDDGSSDNTEEVAKAASGGAKEVIVKRHERNMGKGSAVRTGALASTRPYVLFSDADLSTPIEELENLAPYAAQDTVVIASRGLKESRLDVRQPFYRETMGRIFNAIVRLLLVPGIRDTQCGFKLFGRKVVETVFPDLMTQKFAFDVEVLARAHRAGFRVVEVPVRWLNDPNSRVHPLRDSAIMLRDVLRLWWSLRNERPSHSPRS